VKEKFVNFFMKVASSTAELSHAKRLQVGAVIVKDNNIISFGYNGMPAGMDNCCEDIVYEQHDEEIVSTTVTKPEVIHAEANAITKLARQGGAGQDSTMFVTHAPCVECAKLIVQTGIKTVYFRRQYRDSKGVELLHTAGITVNRLETL
jgi:dCMP deaminase